METQKLNIIFKISWFERLFYTSSNSGEKWMNFWTQELVITFPIKINWDFVSDSQIFTS